MDVVLSWMSLMLHTTLRTSQPTIDLFRPPSSPPEPPERPDPNGETLRAALTQNALSIHARAKDHCGSVRDALNLLECRKTPPLRAPKTSSVHVLNSP